MIDPPQQPLLADGARLGGWWHTDATSDRIHCDLCPRECHLKSGDRGFCFVRENRDGQMVLTTYGRSTGFCIDPIEKKPLNHFYPGTSVLSFGTAGCNLGCKFCQNHDISKAREVTLLSERALPAAIADAAIANDCTSVAFTYNDPVVWAEYAIDTAKACRERGIQAVAVTAGYISPIARKTFFEAFDAANVDLKGFTEEFYQQLTLSHLQPVLDTLRWLHEETSVWFEITNLVIPRGNDSPDDLRRLCDWVLTFLGDRVPVHFTAFHPDYRLRDRPATPPETLVMAYQLARAAGLKYVYVGNIDDVRHQSTYCGACGELLIERSWYDLGAYHLQGNRCPSCQEVIPGHFADRPGHWGRRRQPVDIARYASPAGAVEEPAVTRFTPQPPTRGEWENPKTTNTLAFTVPQQQAIHQLACEVVAASLQQRPVSSDTHALPSLADRIVSGAYVSLKRRNQLRSCCGFVNQRTPLAAAIVEAATRSACHDFRLPPISVTELPYLELETWLLDPPQRVLATGRKRVDAVEVGRHGLLVAQGAHRGLLLPGVAVESGYEAEQFLAQTCRKAGLQADAWLSDATEVYVFEGVSYRAPFDPQAYQRATTETLPLYSPEQLGQLQAWIASNLQHALRGSTPSYYAPDVSDGMVHLAAISIRPRQAGDDLTACRVSLRPALPLQATLCQLVESAARSLANQGYALADLTELPHLLIGHDPAMHGTLADPDLSGWNSRQRGLLAADSEGWAVAFQPGESPEAVLSDLRSRFARSDRSAATRLYSLSMQSTQCAFHVGSRSSQTYHPPIRTPAVAGRFYPAEPKMLQQALADLFRDLPDRPRRRVAAVLVPHAGWIYSGRLAAEVLAGIQVPDRVLVLGPKHTAAGARYAVAPHRVWQLPGIEVKNDLALGQALIESIPDWSWDAAAHAAEHAIEVEIPLIHYLAPNCHVTGIALASASWDTCRRFAAGLANVLHKSSDACLLIISSDMNHFANDKENRRLDEIALQAIESGDPHHAYQTIRGQKISMCGLIPTVVVMQALTEIGKFTAVRRVNYGTSADVTGDGSRVVGYAGLELG